jgi:hypothetical protein
MLGGEAEGMAVEVEMEKTTITSDRVVNHMVF